MATPLIFYVSLQLSHTAAKNIYFTALYFMGFSRGADFYAVRRFCALHPPAHAAVRLYSAVKI